MNLPPCPECGTPVQMDWDWCHECGYDPEGLRPAPAPAAPAVEGSPPSPVPPPRPPPPDDAAPPAPRLVVVPPPPPSAPPPPKPPPPVEVTQTPAVEKPTPIKAATAFARTPQPQPQPASGWPAPSWSAPTDTAPTRPAPGDAPQTDPWGGPVPYMPRHAAPARDSISKEKWLAIACGGVLLVGAVAVLLIAVALSRQTTADEAAPVLSTTLPLATSPWMTFRAPDSSFSAAFPVPPAARDQTIPTEGGGTVTARMYRAQSDGAGFGVLVAELPPDTTVDPSEVAAAIATGGGEIAYETPARLGGHDALDVRIDGHNGQRLTTTVTAGSRVVVIEYAAENPDPEVWQRFRSSVVINPG